ncbi:MAG: DUF2780 domain-containing protein [Lentisphaerae bacterium]|jgi:hypothetical protein|nr:DUF2780 domain-containing protein [Lentisphaerota bacterium]
MTELVSELVSKLGVENTQAKGGAGLILKLAQEKLGGDFSKVAAAIPGAKDLISAAPAAAGGAKLIGGLLGSIGGDKAKGLSDLAGLAGGFAQLNLDSGMVTKFVPIILQFAKSKGGQDAMSLLAKVLQK